MAAIPTAEARLDLRLDPKDKALIEYAARLRGMKLSAFVRAAVLRESREMHQSHADAEAAHAGQHGPARGKRRDSKSDDDAAND